MNPPGSDPQPTAPGSGNFPPPVSTFNGPIAELVGHGLLAPPNRPGLLASLDRFEVLKVLGGGGMGVVLLARNRRCCRLLQLQFLAGDVDKRYLVRVAGHPAADRFAATAPIAAAPGALGTHGVADAGGRDARTEFVVLERLADGTALLNARLLTGRTNQIRVHLWHLGLPVLGDPAYLAGGLLGDTQTLDTAAPPLCLHAWRLAFKHPLSGERMEFEADCPWASPDIRHASAARRATLCSGSHTPAI